jgi:hypothetical protein
MPLNFPRQAECGLRIHPATFMLIYPRYLSLPIRPSHITPGVPAILGLPASHPAHEVVEEPRSPGRAADMLMGNTGFTANPAGRIRTVASFLIPFLLAAAPAASVQAQEVPGAVAYGVQFVGAP